MSKLDMTTALATTIATVHPRYKENIEEWTVCRDTFEGQKKVKNKGVTYLPKLSSQKEEDYQAYKKRASFYGAMARTVHGMAGMLFRKPVIAEYPTGMEKYFIESDPAITSCSELFKQISLEQLINARPSIFIDMPEEGGDPYPVLIPAENFINWRQDSEDNLTLVVYSEVKEFFNTVNAYDVVEVTCYRELVIEDGIYKVYLWQPDSLLNNGIGQLTRKGPIIPEVNGQPLTKIPFFTVNTTGVDVKIHKPPLLDLAWLNISHYMNSADLEHGRHFTALPTPVITGADGDVVMKIGSQTAWVLPDDKANAFFLEFKGEGLSSLEKALTEKERLMATLSSKLIEQTSNGSESPETVRLRYTGEVATLTGMATVSETVLTTVYQTIAEWIGKDSSVIKIQISRDFLNERLSSQQLTALLNIAKEGGISLETFLANLERGDYLQLGESADDEFARLAKTLITPEATNGTKTDTYNTGRPGRQLEEPVHTERERDLRSPSGGDGRER